MKPAGRLRSLGCVLFAAAAFACSSDNPTPSGTPSAHPDRLSVNITPDHDSTPLGSSRLYMVEVNDESTTVATTAVSWSSTNTDVVTIDSHGLATSVGEGAAQVVATVLGAVDTASVEVVGHASLLQIAPGAASMFIGDEIQVSAETGDTYGTSAPALKWSSSDTIVAKVSGEGLVTALGAGKAEIVATRGTTTARVPVEVTASTIASLTIAPAASSIAVGGNATLAVTALSPAGRRIRGGFSVVWQSSDSSIASVDREGRVRTRALGYATIRASIGEATATATVHVTHAPASTIALTPSDTALLKGESLALSASVKDTSGGAIQAPAVAWRSSDAKVASVDNAGHVSALGTGKATISAVSGSAVAAANITVASRFPTSLKVLPAVPTVLVGGHAQLLAQVLDQHGKPLAGHPITWTTSNSGIVSVTESGMISGAAPGVTSIVATSRSLRAEVNATVASVPISDFDISPSSATLDQGGSLTLVTTSRDAVGNALSERVVSWSSSNPEIVSIDAKGTATGMAPGTAAISATVEGKTATTSVVVRGPSPFAVAVIDISANSPSLISGQSTQAVATLRAKSGEKLSGRPIAWASLDSSIARVSPTGMITAMAAGSVSITATSGGAHAALAIVVTASQTSEVANVGVVLSPTVIASGKTAKATVTIKDAQGKVLTGRTVTYVSTKNAVATVSPGGVVTGVAKGEAGIRATSDGVTGVAWLHVTTGTAPVARVDVRAPATTLNLASTVQAAADLYDAAGKRLTGSVTWSSSRAAIAKVSPTGLITAVSAGSATIKAAAAGGVTGSLGITVTAAAPKPVATVNLNLATASLVVGQTSQVSAVGLDVLGKILAGLTFTYTSSNTAVATVTQAGKVTALKSGTASISARSGGKVGSAPLTVTATNPPPTTPPPTPPPGNAAAALAKIGPTISTSAASALGGGYAKYDALWSQWEPTRFKLDGTAWDGDYYDRVQLYYAQWIRTGNGSYKTRGDAMALDYRRKYLHANNYNTSAHWSQLDGVALHYWLTGDDSSRIAVGKAALSLAGTALWPRNGQWTDARQQARALVAMLLAWQTNAPYAPSGGWAKAIDDGLTAILPQQSADGGWRYPVNTCNLSLNYMGAMLSDALIRVYTQYRPDSRIPGAVRKTADFLWTQWRPNDATPSFNYYEGKCSNQHGSGGPSGTADLTGIFVSTYAWMSAQDQSYRTKSDAVFSATMKGLYPQGSKQFNQGFAFGWRALGYLR